MRALLFLLLLLLPCDLIFARQGGRADYQRAAEFPRRFEGVGTGERFQGDWLDGHRLWRVSQRVGGTALELIDPEGARGERLREIPVSRLGLTGMPARVEPEESGAVLVLGREGKVVRWLPGSQKVEPLTLDDEATRVFDVPVARRRAPRRSRRGGASTRLVLLNDTDEPLRLEWATLDGGRRGYGTLAPGDVTAQHTFAGHVFVLVGEDGEDRSWVRATAEVAVARLAGADPEPRQRRRGDRASKERPVQHWQMRLTSGDLVFERPEDGKRVTLARRDEEAGVRYSGPPRWSADRRYVILWRVEQEQDHPVTFVESSPREQLQPVVHTQQYLKPGDRIRQRYPVLIRLDPDADVEPVLVPTGVEPLIQNAYSLSSEAWSEDATRFSFLYNQRGHRVLRLVSIDAESGEASVVVEEAPETFVDYAHKSFLHRFPVTEGGGEHLLWMTERSGWNHLLLVDAKTGETVREVTSGRWVVRAVDEVDDEGRRVFLRVMGVFADQDPYHVHHAVVDVDSGEMTLLTRGDGTHTIELSPDGRWLIDRWSRVDLPEQAALRPVGKGRSMDLARGSTKNLEAAGWRAPERFKAKGRDGKTDIWGIVVRPTFHDPTKSYPVIEKIYAGPHDHHVPNSFRVSRDVHELAELGFIVVQIDGMGTNWRSKAFHDVAWKNLADAGFPDRVAWLRALAKEDPSVDLDRVGIFGGSAGGQNAMRALIDHPETYKVAVADCGCHDNRMDKIWWNELWMSWPVGPHYAESSNVVHAHRMQGKLLLIVGELDRNVDPASTLQVVDALIRADKDFDMLVIPGAGHGAAETPYGDRRRTDFLVRHLMGVEPRWE